MKRKYRNIFLIIGIGAIVFMLNAFDLDSEELWNDLRKAGLWLPAIILLWGGIYLMNATAWYIIIRDGKGDCPVSFLRIFKLTISGYALNYATPIGLMGGEPYRIMELTPLVGTSKATSSVILYAMMHIFSHFWFWIFSIILYILLRPMNIGIGILLATVGVVCLAAIYFFMQGYRKGLAVRFVQWIGHLPKMGKRARQFSEDKSETLKRIDAQIAALHKQQKSTFYTSLGLEFSARIVGCLEVYFILRILSENVNFADCILIMAFTSLFANIFFFSPMQLGVREGGFALSTGGLSIPGAFGVYTGLITRVRELFWIIIGVLLMKIGNGTSKHNNQNRENIC